MDQTGPVAVVRPKRWDEPMDPLMSDSDVAWLRSRQPFSQLNAKSFLKSMPLDGILRNDCRLHRVLPGQIVVREGDYGNSAFLVLSGSVRVLVESLSPQQLGRTEPRRQSWTGALWEFFRPSEFPEARTIDQVVPPSRRGQDPSQCKSDPNPTVFLQDFNAVLNEQGGVALGPGELFGEIAAMYRSPRTATVIAENEAALLEIRWQGLKSLRRDPGFSDQLDAHYRGHWLPMHLRELPLMRFVPPEHLQHVVAATQMRSFGRMEWNEDYVKTRQLSPAAQIASEPMVVDQSHHPTELIVVRAGFGRLCRRHGDAHMTTAYLGKGQAFGLAEIIHNCVRDPSSPPRVLENQLRAVGFLDTLHIPIETFAQHVLPFVRRDQLPADVASLVQSPAEIRTQLLREAGLDRRKTWRERRGRQRGGTATARPLPIVSSLPNVSSLPIVTRTDSSQADATSLLEFIVQHRFNNGREAMVIDLHRCTRCDDCVTACAATHDGNSRFVRDGQRHHRLQFVQACMHCTDPVCMIGCPTAAITRDQTTGVVTIDQPICIGCQTCANACPYQNIRMAQVSDPQGRPYTDAKSGKPIQKATKCDLCQGRPGGAACVAACPHDALVRIDLSQPHPLEDWLHQRNA